VLKVKYKKVVIYYFSGTGNTKNTAFWIGDEATKKGIDFEIISINLIDYQNIQKPAEYTLVGFCSPTHGFHFPEIMRKFIYNFPKVINCDAFILNTRAGVRIYKLCLPGLSGILHYWSSILLMMKGFTITGLFPVDLPSNWISIHPSLKKNGTDLIYQHVEPKVRKFAVDILNGKKRFRALYDIIQDFLISPVTIGYIFCGKYFFAKSFIASLDCNDCGLCISSCPVKAIIKMNGRMFWTHKCESCMKCMNCCPKKAIETAHGFVAIACIITLVGMGYVINKILSIPSFSNRYWLQDGTIKLFIFSIVVLPILFFSYRIMHRLLKYKFFDRLVVYTSLTKIKFWGRYKAPKLKNSREGTIEQKNT
jgi:ferredoxin